MRPMEVIGWVDPEEGSAYCPDCSPSNGFDPIFAYSEADIFTHCDVCGGLIPEQLTPAGKDWVLALARKWLVRRVGYPDAQRQWYEHSKTLFREQTERTVIALWGESLEEANVLHAKYNLLAP